MRGAIVFVVWLALFVAEIAASGVLGFVLWVAMIGAAFYGGFLFARWRAHR